MRTIQGDTVDRICYRHLGSTAAVTAVYALNPGLCERGPVLPTGTEVRLPVPEAAPRTPTHSSIQLWD
ncbi:tail protein X [Larsenimonas suaedae]|uniref:tail protein X n=1 Tax=Larsenimonas suaedae TaxID=1851019 RepID=UPI0032E7F70A